MNQVELPASRGDVCRHTLAQDVFFHHDPVPFDVRIIGFEFGREFLSSIIAGLLTVAMVTVFCWARTLAPVSRTANRGNAKRSIFGILLFG
jgi:hypothetical protein